MQKSARPTCDSFLQMNVLLSEMSDTDDAARTKAERIKEELASLDAQRREVDEKLRAMDEQRPQMAQGGRGRGGRDNGGRGGRAPYNNTIDRPSNPALLRERPGATLEGDAPRVRGNQRSRARCTYGFGDRTRRLRVVPCGVFGVRFWAIIRAGQLRALPADTEEMLGVVEGVTECVLSWVRRGHVQRAGGEEAGCDRESMRRASGKSQHRSAACSRPWWPPTVTRTSRMPGGTAAGSVR